VNALKVFFVLGKDSLEIFKIPREKAGDENVNGSAKQNLGKLLFLRCMLCAMHGQKWYEVGFA
jgi:hypothetical protein